MNGNDAAPDPFLVVFRNDGNNVGDIHARRQTEKESEEINCIEVFDERQAQIYACRDHQGYDDRLFRTEEAGEYAGKENAARISYGDEGGNAACFRMADMELVLQEGENRREDGPSRKIEKPKEPDKREKKKGLSGKGFKTIHDMKPNPQKAKLATFVSPLHLLIEIRDNTCIYQ
jgi:hypothetical protein